MKESDLERDLKGIIGDRVTTSEFERWFYTSDIMHIPRGIRAMFKTVDRQRKWTHRRHKLMDTLGLALAPWGE